MFGIDPAVVNKVVNEEADLEVKVNHLLVIAVAIANKLGIDLSSIQANQQPPATP